MIFGTHGTVEVSCDLGKTLEHEKYSAFFRCLLELEEIKSVTIERDRVLVTLRLRDGKMTDTLAKAAARIEMAAKAAEVRIYESRSAAEA